MLLPDGFGLFVILMHSIMKILVRPNREPIAADHLISIDGLPPEKQHGMASV